MVLLLCAVPVSGVVLAPGPYHLHPSVWGWSVDEAKSWANSMWQWLIDFDDLAPSLIKLALASLSGTAVYGVLWLTCQVPLGGHSLEGWLLLVLLLVWQLVVMLWRVVVWVWDLVVWDSPAWYPLQVRGAAVPLHVQHWFFLQSERWHVAYCLCTVWRWRHLTAASTAALLGLAP